MPSEKTNVEQLPPTPSRCVISSNMTILPHCFRSACAADRCHSLWLGLRDGWVEAIRGNESRSDKRITASLQVDSALNCRRHAAAILE
jgi:hypothetical protein